ncbi:MAG: hypothetical protein AAGI30_10210 [Planctomycetota bacterium]
MHPTITAAATVVAIAGSAFGQLTGSFPGAIDLSSLLPANGGDGSLGFVINSLDDNDRTDRSISSAGDVNGDGVDGRATVSLPRATSRPSST